MAFRFKLSEKLGDGVRRIATEQLAAAERQLAAGEDPVAAVHDARKALKRVRALLRLVRPGLPDAVFAKENARLRDAARLLSPVRDLDVLASALTLAVTAAPKLDASLIPEIEKAIAAARAAEHAAAGRSGAPDAIKAIRGSRRALCRARLDSDALDVVLDGLARSYRNFREAFDEAYAEPGDEAFHELRKEAQLHWRHMLLLSRAWPDLAKARSNAARAISDRLGAEQDLALLARFVATTEAMPGARRSRVDLVRAIERQRRALRAEARPLGERLLAESPKRLCRMLAVSWRAAVAIKTGEAG